MNLKTIGLILLVAGLAIFSVSFASGLLSIGPTTSVRVVDVDTGLGVDGAAAMLYIDVSPDGISPEVYTFPAVTDESGLAVFDLSTLPNYPRPPTLVVDVEGYTSDRSRYGFSFYDDSLVEHQDPSGEATWLVELYTGEPAPVPTPSGDLIVEIINKNSGLGIADASVYIFENSVQIDVKITNSSGVAVFENLNGFYHVGVIVDGYTSDLSTDGYSYFGAAGVGQDLTYRIELSPADIASEVSEMGVSLFMVVGVVVSCVGAGFIAYDRWLG